MRRIVPVLFLAIAAGLSAPAAAADASAKDAALDAGNWRRAAELGASAGELVRTLQARGKLADVVADEAVVTIGPDNAVDVVSLAPLPPLPADVAGPQVRTAGLSGSGFAFGARRGAIILYPPGADTFAARQPAP